MLPKYSKVSGRRRGGIVPNLVLEGETWEETENKLGKAPLWAFKVYFGAHRSSRNRMRSGFQVAVVSPEGLRVTWGLGVMILLINKFRRVGRVVLQ